MKIITIVGARPQFVKAAVVSRAIEEHNKIATSEHIEEKIIHTNQHYDDNMSDIFFEEMCIPKPHYNLHLGGRKCRDFLNFPYFTGFSAHYIVK